MAGIKILNVNEDENTIEFTKDEIQTVPELPGVSLGRLVIFRDDLEKQAKIPKIPTQYKDGYVDRIFEVFVAAKLLLTASEGPAGIDVDFIEKTRPIWLSIWHILKDEFKQDSFIINLTTGEVYSDLNHQVSCKTN